MSAPAVEFIVWGRPAPAGSKTGFAIRRAGVVTGQVAMVESARKRLRPWQALIKDAALRAMSDRELLTGALMLDVEFYVARPAGHYRSGRHAGRVRDSAPSYPAVRPDLTKLLRGLEDALTGLVWRDDAQIVTQSAHKLYGTPECTVIFIEDMLTGEPSTPPAPRPNTDEPSAGRSLTYLPTAVESPPPGVGGLPPALVPTTKEGR